MSAGLICPDRQEMKLLNNALEDEKRIRISLQVGSRVFFTRFSFSRAERTQLNVFSRVVQMEVEHIKKSLSK